MPGEPGFAICVRARATALTTVSHVPLQQVGKISADSMLSQYRIRPVDSGQQRRLDCSS